MPSSPERWHEEFLGGGAYLYTLLLYCGRLDFYDSVRRLCIHGVKTLDATDLLFISSTTMEDLLNTWRRTPRFRQKQDRLWNQYLTFLDSVGPFGGECWLLVHASLCWLLDPEFLITLPSALVFGHSWDKMLVMRSHFGRKLQHVSRIQFLRQAVCYARIDMHLPALPLAKIRPRIPPKWERLQVSSLILVPVSTARHLLWRFLSATFDNYFLNNCAAYPFGFCGGLTFLFEILNQSNCQEAFSYCYLIDVTRPAEHCDMFALHSVVSLTMDDLLKSWRRAPLASNDMWTRLWTALVPSARKAG
jgi:hypothetical protein